MKIRAKFIYGVLFPVYRIWLLFDIFCGRCWECGTVIYVEL